MTTKLHINLQQGLLEVEGEESFVRVIYEDFKVELRSAHENRSKPGQSEGAKSLNPATPGKRKTSTKSTRPKKDDLKVDKELDLSGVGSAGSLKDYVKKHAPKSNMDRNVMFVDYLKEEMHIDKVTVDHVWTCYHHLELKLPVDMRQSIIDAGRDVGKHRLNTSSLQDLSLSVHGKNWLRDQVIQSAEV